MKASEVLHFKESPQTSWSMAGAKKQHSLHTWAVFLQSSPEKTCKEGGEETQNTHLAAWHATICRCACPQMLCDWFLVCFFMVWLQVPRMKKHLFPGFDDPILRYTKMILYTKIQKDPKTSSHQVYIHVQVGILKWQLKNSHIYSMWRRPFSFTPPKHLFIQYCTCFHSGKFRHMTTRQLFGKVYGEIPVCSVLLALSHYLSFSRSSYSSWM